jgi:regulator of RNase E activity RraA
MTEENKKILEAYKGLRVADVRDGLDWCGMMHYGSMDASIRPLYRTISIGIARTVRYLPYQGPTPFLTGEKYSEWSAEYYRKIGTFPFMEKIEEGDFICIDQSGLNIGLMGSNSALAGKRNGAVGWVSNGGLRDTDEVILEEIAFWSKEIGQPMVQGRLQFDGMDIPVAIGGVVVYPGDVVVADGDGVVVVPRKIAFDVAKYARQELDHDKIGRRKLYKELGMKEDATVL